jgi:parallel beta-helix repeat protein
MLSLLLVSVFASASKLRTAGAWSGTVYIRADGSVEGTGYIESNDNFTYVLTADFNESVVVERSNIVVDGNGHTLNGSGLVGADGFRLANVNNVTIRKTNIVNFASGIALSQSSGSVIVESNITNSSIGISIDSQSSKNIISGNRIANVGTGVFSGMGASSNVISENTIEGERYFGIRPSGFNNVVSGNNISAYVSHGDQAGIYLEDSIYTDVSRNRIENSSVGIWVGDWAENDNISGNVVMSSHYGMHLTDLALYNHIRGNSVEGTETCSIVSYASYNYIYHNNIISDGARAVQIVDGFSFWDDGYPSGGNQWSFLDAVEADVCSGVHQNETGGDGILDKPFMIQGSSIDRYPLAGSFNTFYAGTWNGTEYDFDIVSNSTVTDSNFNLTADPPTLSLNLEGTNGFCRVTIPKNVMWCDNPDQWIITTGDHATLQRKVIEESSYTYIYFTYDQANRTFLVQSTHAIPEFPSPVIMLSFMAVAALTTVMHRRKRI